MCNLVYHSAYKELQNLPPMATQPGLFPRPRHKLSTFCRIYFELFPNDVGIGVVIVVAVGIVVVVVDIVVVVDVIEVGNKTPKKVAA